MIDVGHMYRLVTNVRMMQKAVLFPRRRRETRAVIVSRLADVVSAADLRLQLCSKNFLLNNIHELSLYLT
jgi:hypothetical protein